MNCVTSVRTYSEIGATRKQESGCGDNFPVRNFPALGARPSEDTWTSVIADGVVNVEALNAQVATFLALSPDKREVARALSTSTKVAPSPRVPSTDSTAS
jgi:hypothetical protein